VQIVFAAWFFCLKDLVTHDVVENLVVRFHFIVSADSLHAECKKSSDLISKVGKSAWNYAFIILIINQTNNDDFCFFKVRVTYPEAVFERVSQVRNGFCQLGSWSVNVATAKGRGVSPCFKQFWLNVLLLVQDAIVVQTNN